ncbi:PDR/VanB family oxidoreductase [Microbacterium sp. RD1]|uniref:PDR/VanB family oxidoreductase n=1 Tax=Microbacterium sp. RD1 TaxID=3457313 RepID=UPI003FA54A93
MKLIGSRQIVAVDHLTPDIVGLDIDGPFPPTPPGAHLEIAFAGFTRRYSVVFRTPSGGVRVAVRHDRGGRGGSAWVHENLTTGDRVVVSGPFDEFVFDQADAAVFVAGGIGITPLMSMIDAAVAAGTAVRVLYLGRERRHLPFVAELRALVPDAVVHESLRDGRRNVSSWITETLAADRFHDAAVYACGPGPLLRDLELMGLGDRLRSERFTEAGRAGDRPFDVEVFDGRRIRVDAGTTMLDALLGAGVPMLYSCRRGDCGTCEVPVLAGDIEHRDHILDAEERASGSCMMPCVSRAGAGTVVRIGVR